MRLLLLLLCAGITSPAPAMADWVLLNPKGPIAAAEDHLILVAFGLMLVVVIPVFVMTFLFVWKYRESNPKAIYTPDWSHSTAIEIVVWLVPAILISVLSWMVWDSSHRLSPYRPLHSSLPPLTVQVVAMDWKWLFIYPDLGLASVNRLIVPSNTPLDFSITSDAVMSSFFIPQWGGQIYAMAGMKTQLHLWVDEPGQYEGWNTQFSGDGFSGMSFPAIALPEKSFQAWVHNATLNPSALDVGAFRALEAPSEDVPPHLYSSVSPHLFDRILRQYHGMTDMPRQGQ